MQIFGAALLKIKENPEIVQAGYTALSNILRLILRQSDQDNEEMKSFAILEICINGLMQGNKNLPHYSQKLCASAVGQIIRRSKEKAKCVQFLLERCQKCPELAAKIFVRSIKLIEKSDDIKIDIWKSILNNIDIDLYHMIFVHVIDNLADMTSENIEKTLIAMLENFEAKADNIKEEHLAQILEIGNKALNLARGKKIKMEAEFCKFMIKLANILSEEEKYTEKMKNLMMNLCSVPSEVSFECLKFFMTHEKLELQAKLQILYPLVQSDVFEKSYLPKFVQILMKNRNQVRPCFYIRFLSTGSGICFGTSSFDPAP